MGENIQVQDELSLAEIFKVLWRQIKVLIITLLCGIVAGAGIAVAKTVNVNYYGTTVSFYINPRLDRASSTEVESQYGVYGAYGMHVMNNMVLLLSSELFSEQLLLEENGLPSAELIASLGSPELKIKVDEAIAAQAKADEAVGLVNEQLSKLSEQNQLVSKWTTEVNTLWAAYRNAHPKDELNSTPTIIEGETDLNNAINELTNAKAKVEVMKEDLKNAESLADADLQKANNSKNDALKIWREVDKDYVDKINLVNQSVSFAFMEKEVESIEDANNLARSFIYVNISVLNDKEFAEFLLTRIREHIPSFVEENMPVPSGYDGTNCQRITRLDKIENTNPYYMLESILKYGLLLGAVALVVACIVVVLVDRSNKKLTDYERVMERFKVPVLGVIPSITEKEDKEEPAEAANAEVKE